MLQFLSMNLVKDEILQTLNPFAFIEDMEYAVVAVIGLIDASNKIKLQTKMWTRAFN